MPRPQFRHVFLTACVSLAALTAAPALAEDAQDWGKFGVQTQWVDPATRPGNDFDGYVNGKWNVETQIPEDKVRIGAFMSLRDLSEERVRGILDELVAGTHPAGSPEARIADSYKAFMDVAAIEKAGLAPAKPWLDQIARAKSIRDIAVLFASPGFATPVQPFVEADQKQSDRYVLQIAQTGMGLPDRDYYLKDTERFRDVRAKYKDHLAFLLSRAGYADAKAAASAVFALETELARASWDRTQGRNRDFIYNRLDRPALARLDRAKVLATMMRVMGVAKAPAVVVAQMPPTAEELKAAGVAAETLAESGLSAGVPATLALIEKTPVSVWKAWLTARFLRDSADMLPSDIADAEFAISGKLLNGQPQQRARWKRGVAVVEQQLGELLGRIYAERYYPAANKAAMDDLVANLRKAMAANLLDLKWMGPQTRQAAQAKLDAFTPKIGRPGTFKDYKGQSVSASNPIANSIAAQDWALTFTTARLGQAVDKAEWHILPQTVNAYYNPVGNEVVFPAAILQPPFFNVDADPAVNYGAIGAVIGHELGHGFDDQGAKSDGAGNLRDWWTSNDKANFEGLQDRLAAQYDAFCPFDGGKTCVNGRFTMGENIGDVGGLSLAYRAYQLSLGGKPAPVIDGFTGDQRFFMAWAQVWRGKIREQLARQYLIADPHSPQRYRTNGVVRNFDEWYKAFDVKPGDALYLPPEERVRIW